MAAEVEEEMLVPAHQWRRYGDEAATAAEEDPSIDSDKLSYEIFSILESKFLFGYDDHKLWIPTVPPPAASVTDAPPAQAAEASSFKNQRGKVCVLCIDGGGGCGMRGILPGKALAYLEQALKTKSGDPDARISDYFDVAAGAGVGGVFAAMLFATRDGTRPLFHADDTWRFLADQGKRLFRKGSSPSSSSSSTPGMFLRCLFPSGEGSTTAAIERAMKEAFGESLTLRDTVKPVLIPCYDLRSSAPFVFSRADALESESFDFRLWEVCRATWAEPGRFEPAEISSVDGAAACVGVDGGLAMSNPAAAAITHVLHNKQEFPFVRGVEDLMVLSLGCGEAGGAAAPFVSEAENRKLRRWGPKEWARPISRIAADVAADLVDQAVALAFGQCRSSNYVRVQVRARSGFHSYPSSLTRAWWRNWSCTLIPGRRGRGPPLLQRVGGCGTLIDVCWLCVIAQADASSMGRCSGEVDYDGRPGTVKVLTEAAEEMLRQKNVESVLFGGKRVRGQTNMEKLDWFAEELVLEHRRRSCRIAPTVAFKRAQPRKSATTSVSSDEAAPRPLH
ncbi:hypothetical protein GW17_00032075 [Ensete ventricosum]|nr:hypothetical protein GW17_00032075 [Ensete ventricosum]